MNAQDLLTAVESDGKGPLSERAALELLLARAEAGMAQPFLDACFHAKFVVRSQEVLRRIGPGADGFDKLSAEFQAGVERTMTLLRTIVKEAPGPERDRFVAGMLAVDGAALERFLSLCVDLARIKNWEVDGRPLPFGPSSAAAPDRPAVVPGSSSMVLLRRAARLALVLFVLLLIFDGPDSVPGWVVSVMLLGLFIVIEISAARHQKEKGT